MQNIVGNLVIAVVGNKGGIGKTTLSYNLHYLFIKKEISSVLIDCDNDQYSSADFAEDRKDAGIKPDLRVINLPTEELEKELAKLSKEVQVMIIEFGKSNNDKKEKFRNEALELAIKVADIIIMPLQPTAPDVKTVPKVEAKLPLAARNVPAIIVPNRVKKENQLEVINGILPQLKYFKVSKTFLGDRLCYQDSLGFDGRSVFEIKTKESKKAQKEFNQLFEELFNE